MVARDLAAAGITDQRVLAAMGEVAREQFVDRSRRHEAYGDHPLPIGDGQTISQPYMVALMAQVLELKPTDRVLDVGTGSGYAAAVMSLLAAEVWSIERHAALAMAAADRLRELGYDNVHVTRGDGTKGWPEHAPFDAVCVAAAATRVPQALIDQLAPGGRLVIPIGTPNGVQQLQLVTREDGGVVGRFVCDVRFVPLVADTG